MPRPRCLAAKAAILAAPLLSTGCSPRTVAQDEPGWRDAFTINSTMLSTTGESPYAILRPGSVWHYAGGGEELTITVLDQIVQVDAIPTRVVEEREGTQERLTEVSLNYFAIDLPSGDLFYFGEDVDLYQDGAVAGHAGVWRSGVDGARFGLFVPGKPVVGDRYYQEIAPGVAMDRAEVVSTDEQVRTPAGLFEHCLHIRETSPLEKGSGDKWFAPGVGLVRDDDLELTSYTIAGR